MNIIFTNTERESHNIIKAQEIELEKTIRVYDQIKEIGFRSIELLQKADIEGFGEAMDMHWGLKKQLTNNMSNNGIDEMYIKLKKLGSPGGKIIGGGMPIGAVAGGKQLMENLAPTGSVYQAGTLSGNPLSVAAGIATLTELSKPSSYARLERLGSLMDQVIHTSGSNNLEFVRLGSMFWPYFCSGKPRAAHEIKESAIKHFNDSYTGFLDKGFYLPPSGYEVCFLSTAHSENECNSLIKALISAADNGLTGDLKK